MNVLWFMFDSLRRDTYRSCSHHELLRLRSKGFEYNDVISPSGFTLLSCSSMWTGKFPQHCSVNLLDPTQASREHWVGKVRVPSARLTDVTVFDHFSEGLVVFEKGTTSWTFTAYRKAGLKVNLDDALSFSAVLREVHNLAWNDTIVFIRLYNTHLPYNRFLSPLRLRRDGEDAMTPLSVSRRRVAEVVKREGEAAILDIQKYALCFDIETFVIPLLNLLNDLRVLETTLIIFCSDHGDRYSSHAEDVGHGRFNDEEVIRVPLLFLGPFVPSGTTDYRIGLVDVASMILELRDRSADRADALSWFGSGINTNGWDRAFFHNTLDGRLSVLKGDRMVSRGLLERDFEYRSDWRVDGCPGDRYADLERSWEKAMAPFARRLKEKGGKINSNWRWAGNRGDSRKSAS